MQSRVPEFSSDQKKRHLFRYSEFHASMAIFQLRIKRTVQQVFVIVHCNIMASLRNVMSKIHSMHIDLMYSPKGNTFKKVELLFSLSYIFQYLK